MKPGDAEALRLAVGLLEQRLRQLPAAGLRGSELFVLATVEALGYRAFESWTNFLLFDGVDETMHFTLEFADGSVAEW